LAVGLACWLLLLVVRRERFAAPHFFWPLLAYGGITLVSALLSTDVRASLLDCKQLVLFLIVPATYRFVSRSRAPMLMTVILTVCGGERRLRHRAVRHPALRLPRDIDRRERSATT
jgi:hypothetical protein